MTLNIGIVGATGYTGAELLRLLSRHAHARVSVISSRQEAGRSIGELYPHLDSLDLKFVEPEIKAFEGCDLVFFATPHAAAMHQVPQMLDAGIKVIDLSADFRIKDPVLWEKTYATPHVCPELLPEAVYGLPEVNRNQIAEARLVAAPGCYPTAVQLGLLPLVEAGLVDASHLIADVKSGVSGAGRGAKVASLHCETSESFAAYAASGHRHLPEIVQGLGSVSKTSIGLTFVPHLVPMNRGIHATLYARLNPGVHDIQAVFEQHYAHEPFVRVMPAGAHPATADVKGANDCRIALHRPGNGETLVVLSVIDNLVKGAAGQAIQCMNIMFGFDERDGLNVVPLRP